MFTEKGRFGINSFDMSLDGQRFIAFKNVRSGQDETQQIVIVDNWFTELERLVPTQ